MAGSEWFPFSRKEVEWALGDPALPQNVADLQAAAATRFADVASSVRRSIVELIAIAFGMELFRQAVLQDITIGPFKVQDLSIFQKILPVLAAYLVYDLWVTALEAIRLSSFLACINDIYRPQLNRSNFASIVYPAPPPLAQGIPHWLRARGMLGSTSIVFVTVFGVARTTLPWLLIATWYVQLFQRFGFRDATTWVSLFLATCFLTYTAILLALARRRGIL